MFNEVGKIPFENDCLTILYRTYGVFNNMCRDRIEGSGKINKKIIIYNKECRKKFSNISSTALVK